MANRNRVTGVDHLIAKLNIEIKKIEGRTIRGLVRAAIMFISDTERHMPKTPVDWGNLRQSRFIITNAGGTYRGAGASFEGPNASKIGTDHGTVMAKEMGQIRAVPMPVVSMGFSAYYAWYVHEMVGDINWNRMLSGPKFFEASINRNKRRALKLIAKEARIPT